MAVQTQHSAVAALLLATFAACGGQETWLFSAEERHFTRCAEEFDTGSASYEQQGQANVIVQIYRGPHGALSVGWEPTLTGLMSSGEFSVGWQSDRQSSAQAGERTTEAWISFDGVLSADSLEGVIVEASYETTTGDFDGDGVDDTSERGCYQENPLLGWRL